MTAEATFGIAPMRSSRLGGASELRAAVHLLEQGYDVYRAVADCAPFDLVAYYGGHMWRVEVKTLSAPWPYRHCPTLPWPTNPEWDLLLAVAPDRVFQFKKGMTALEMRTVISKHYDLPDPKSAARSTGPRYRRSIH